MSLNAPLDPPAAGRPHWPTLHRSTWIVVVLAMAGLLLANVPGERVAGIHLSYLSLDFDEGSSCEHGWPFVFLSRDNDTKVSLWSITEELTLAGADDLLTDAAMARLGVMKRLRSLRLHGSAITDDGLATLARLPSLEQVQIFESELTGRGLRALGGLSRLWALCLVENRVDDDGLAGLAPIRQLRFLALRDATISDTGLDHLNGLSR
jgi:hypothetical protein